PDNALLYTLTGINGPIQSVAFSANSQLLAAASGGDFGSPNNLVLVWRVADGALYHNLDVGMAAASQVAFSPDDQMIAVHGQKVGNQFNTDLRIWRLSDWTVVRELRGGAGINSFQFSPDSTMVAIAETSCSF